MSKVNVEIVRAVYDAFAQRDLAAVFAFFDHSVEMTQSAEVPWGGQYVGHEGARKFFGKLMDNVQSKVETERFIDAGDHVVQVGHTRGTVHTTDRRFDVPEVHVWTLRNGKIIRFQAYIDHPPMLVALGKS